MMQDSLSILNPDGQNVFILTADHAGAQIPAHYNRLGLHDQEGETILGSHRAYDIGVLPMVKFLSHALDAPAIVNHVSRLVLDVNRHPDDPTLIRPIYDRKIIPHNYPITENERRHRIEKFHSPFHQAIDNFITKRADKNQPCFLMSIHSFTPQMVGAEKRVEDIAILYHEHQDFFYPFAQFIA